MNQPLISIVVICKDISDFFISNTLPAITGQRYKNWELILLPDKKSDFANKQVLCVPTWPKTGPADKKDIGIQKSKGEIVAFIDDDAYPDEDWLKNAVPYFKDKSVAAACGPGVTPPEDPLFNQVSGWFWASPLGSGGAGTYRCWPEKAREVDDYPTFNLLVRKSDLQKIDGFDSNYWPGEDTKLCHDLVYKLNKKIVYDPRILVYHQRRPILSAHLKQLGRYGLHRGYFAKTLPKTSRRIGYFLPALFTMGTIGGGIFAIFHLLLPTPFGVLFIYTYLVSLGIYLSVDLINGFWVFSKCKDLITVALLIPVTLISHIFYGLMFMKGLCVTSLVSKYDRNRL